MERKSYTRFPDHCDGETPLSVYQAVCGNISSPRNEIYFSFPLTSGGARRLYEEKQPIAEAIPEIIQKNSTFAELVARACEGYFDSEQFTLPTRLGNRGWEECGYIRFWMYFISGIPSQAAQQFERIAHVNTFVFNNHNLPKEMREREYGSLVNQFSRFTRQESILLNPVKSMIFLSDSRASLGCTAEMHIAEELHIQRWDAYLNRHHHRFQEFAETIAPWILDCNEPLSLPFGEFSEDLIVFQSAE